MKQPAAVWQEFVTHNVLEKTAIDQTISESWQICRDHDVNPFQTKGKQLLTAVQLRNKIKANQELISLVKEQLYKVEGLFKELSYLIILSDAEGYIIWRSGNTDICERAKTIGFQEGSLWNEQTVGTNSIGLAIRRKTSSSVNRFEHYAKASQDWYCVASPVFNEYDEVVGILDISFLQKVDDLKFFEIALEMITQVITSDIKKVAFEKQKELLFYYHGKLKEKDGYLCNDHDLVLAVSKSLTDDNIDYVGKRIRQLPIETQSNLFREPLMQQGEIVGYFMHYLGQKEKTASFVLNGVVGESQSFQDFVAELSVVSKSGAPIHLMGETGTGKEVIATSLHNNSQVKDGPFIKVNCGALSETLLESELFGYEAGAFTGANENGKIGKIEAAHQGTLFLDEVEAMPMSMQLALLRVLQEKEVTPIGSNLGKKVAFRLITATNESLRDLVQQGSFREDLFYRIYVIPLEIPSLRERRDDMSALIAHFQKENDWFPNWQAKLLDVVKAYDWPGNIRELNNFLERVMVYYSQKVPSRADLESLISQGSIKEEKPVATRSFSDELEFNQMKEALVAHDGDKQAAAKALGYSKSTFYRKLAKYQL